MSRDVIELETANCTERSIRRSGRKTSEEETFTCGSGSEVQFELIRCCWLRRHCGCEVTAVESNVFPVRAVVVRLSEFRRRVDERTVLEILTSETGALNVIQEDETILLGLSVVSCDTRSCGDLQQFGLLNIWVTERVADGASGTWITEVESIIANSTIRCRSIGLDHDDAITLRGVGADELHFHRDLDGVGDVGGKSDDTHEGLKLTHWKLEEKEVEVSAGSVERGISAVSEAELKIVPADSSVGNVADDPDAIRRLTSEEGDIGSKLVSVGSCHQCSEGDDRVSRARNIVAIETNILHMSAASDTISSSLQFKGAVGKGVGLLIAVDVGKINSAVSVTVVQKSVGLSDRSVTCSVAHELGVEISKASRTD